MSGQVFVVEAHDPRAPSRALWEQIDAEQRRAVVAAVPAEVPLTLFMPEGDLHLKAKAGALDALDGFFKRVGRKVCRSSELECVRRYPGVNTSARRQLLAARR